MGDIMIDPRYRKLASVLVNHSLKVQPGNNVLIELFDTPVEMAEALVEQVYTAGGIPMVEVKNTRILRGLCISGNEDFFRTISDLELYRMKLADCYIGIRGGGYDTAFTDVHDRQMGYYEKLWWKPVHLEERCDRTNWVITKFPCFEVAQDAKMSTEAFEDFFFSACTDVDYGKLEEAQQPLTDLMTATDKVRIVGKGTDLSFSMKDIGAVNCAGSENIPDGEVYASPVKESVNGIITFNAASTYRGFTFENIMLEFKNGRVIDSDANNSERLEEILNADEGSRYIGEFALGTNPAITQPANNILFDEKISGSLHMALGDSITNQADNGNRSSIHWDLVLMQTPEYGGGELYFDDVLVRRDGVFTIDELKLLNRENLIYK